MGYGIRYLDSGADHDARSLSPRPVFLLAAGDEPQRLVRQRPLRPPRVMTNALKPQGIAALRHAPSFVLCIVCS